MRRRLNAWGAAGSLLLAGLMLILWPVSHWFAFRAGCVTRPELLTSAIRSLPVHESYVQVSRGRVSVQFESERLWPARLWPISKIEWTCGIHPEVLADGEVRDPFQSYPAGFKRLMGFRWDLDFSRPSLGIDFFHFTFPFWFAVPLLLIWPGIWLKDARRSRRTVGGQCMACGYDLRGSPVGGACPECGQVPSATSSKRDAVDSKPASG